MQPMNIATRRDFLTRGLGIVGVGASLPNFLVRSALAAPDDSPSDRIVVSLFSHNPTAHMDPVIFTLECEGTPVGRIVFRRVWSTDLELMLPPDRSPDAKLVVRASRVWSPYLNGLYQQPLAVSGVNYRPPTAVP